MRLDGQVCVYAIVAMIFAAAAAGPCFAGESGRTDH